MVTALLYPIDILYGAIGVGWYNTAFDYKPTIFNLNGSSETEQKFGWHFGAGVQFPLGGSTDNPSSILTADLRYVFLNYDFRQMPGASNLKSDFVVLNIGLLFHL
jgi:opacity protein-like surface antigen